MSCLKCGLSMSGSREVIVKKRTNGSSSNGRKTLNPSDHGSISNLNLKTPKLDHFSIHTPISMDKALKWWEKSIQPNMIEIHSAQQLVDYLLIADDTLVILCFYSPDCGGCRALHPKICQMAELNPNSTFLNVNYEQHKSICEALHVHVLPFFRFYRGAEGRVCSFSCTNATIKKFKDALAKHGTERCSLYSTTGLNHSELLALESIGELTRKFIPNSSDKMDDLPVRDSIP